MAYVHGPLDPKSGVPLADIEIMRRHVAKVRKDVPPLSPAVARRVSAILYSVSSGPQAPGAQAGRDPSREAG